MSNWHFRAFGERVAELMYGLSHDMTSLRSRAARSPSRQRSWILAATWPPPSRSPARRTNSQAPPWSDFEFVRVNWARQPLVDRSEQANNLCIVSLEACASRPAP